MRTPKLRRQMAKPSYVLQMRIAVLPAHLLRVLGAMAGFDVNLTGVPTPPEKS
jgi:hypothetical protein